MPENSLILTSATPGKVADDASGQNSLLATELLKNMTAKSTSAETVFTKTRVAVTRATDGEQVPAVSSSLVEDVQFGADASAKAAAKAGS